MWLPVRKIMTALLECAMYLTIIWIYMPCILFPPPHLHLHATNVCSVLYTPESFQYQISCPLPAYFTYSYRVVSIKQTSNALEARDAVSLPDFPPNISHSSSLLHSHHNDSQLPCKHHNSLKDVCPDDGLQTTLRQKGTESIKRLHM